MSYSKICSKCGKDQVYSTRGSLKRALEKDAHCPSCSSRESFWKNIDHGNLDDKSVRSDCYVYSYLDPDTGVPFYIGKGVDQRYLVHLNETRETTSNIRKFNKIEKLKREGKLSSINFIAVGLTSRAAYEREKLEIGTWGRKGYDDKGVLLNVCLDARPPHAGGVNYPKSIERK